MTRDKDSQKPPATNRGVTSGRFPSEPQESVSRITDVGVDWLTCTSDKDSVGLAWFEMFQRLAVGPGEWRNPWYDGKADEHLRWGYNPKIGYILMATGSLADVVWQKTVPVARKVTRIDLQVTVRLFGVKENLPEVEYRKNSASQFRKYGLVQTSRSGQTLYVGSRTSCQFGRLYDKGVESGIEEPGLLWRYEVELKKPVSHSVGSQLVDWTVKNSGGVHEAIIPFVFDWFLHRGVGPVFARTGDNRIVTEVGRRVTSDDKKLEWLKTGVRPTVQYLLGKGKADLLSAALGCKVEQLHMFEE